MIYEIQPPLCIETGLRSASGPRALSAAPVCCDRSVSVKSMLSLPTVRFGASFARNRRAWMLERRANKLRSCRQTAIVAHPGILPCCAGVSTAAEAAVYLELVCLQRLSPAAGPWRWSTSQKLRFAQTAPATRAAPAACWLRWGPVCAVIPGTFDVWQRLVETVPEHFTDVLCSVLRWARGSLVSGRPPRPLRRGVQLRRLDLRAPGADGHRQAPQIGPTLQQWTVAELPTTVTLMTVRLQTSQPQRLAM